jgi:hypothetical protein
VKLTFEHKSHPHIEDRKKSGPVKSHGKTDFNSQIALALTSGVGTMWCAYFFAILALVALPEAIHGGLFALVQWVSQTFIQLVMLSVIMVGQNILGEAADKRAEATYKDAEATFHEAREIQKHLLEQDAALNAVLDRLEKMESKAK